MLRARTFTYLVFFFEWLIPIIGEIQLSYVLYLFCTTHYYYIARGSRFEQFALLPPHLKRHPDKAVLARRVAHVKNGARLSQLC